MPHFKKMLYDQALLALAYSEGEEGRFYLWSVDEVSALLGPAAAEVLVRLGSVTGQARYGERARELVRALGGAIATAPLGCCQLLSAAMLLDEEPV